MAVFAPDVTGVGNALPFPTLFDFERADGRTEHVTGVGESEIDIIAYSEAPVVTDGQEMLHHTIHLLCVVERFDGWFEFGAFTITPNGETWNFNGGGNEMIINLYPYEGYVIPGGDEVTPGDVNGDDTINISDVTALIDMILSNSTDGNKAADVNGDGIVNISDVTALIDSLLD